MTREIIGVGAFIDGERALTKKALREALAANPVSVEFDATSAFHTGPSRYRAAELTSAVTLSVCGPDPRVDRRWFATVARSEAGFRVR